jgi:hypothetical protein
MGDLDMNVRQFLAARARPLTRDLGIGLGIFAAVTLAIAFDRATPAISVFDALGFGVGHPGRWLLLALAAVVFAGIFAANMHFARSLAAGWRSGGSGGDALSSLHDRRMVPVRAGRGPARAHRS